MVNGGGESFKKTIPCSRTRKKLTHSHDQGLFYLRNMDKPLIKPSLNSGSSVSLPGGRGGSLSTPTPINSAFARAGFTRRPGPGNSAPRPSRNVECTTSTKGRLGITCPVIIDQRITPQNVSLVIVIHITQLLHWSLVNSGSLV